MMTGKLFRKPLASLLKRYHLLTGGGYSVGKAYGARFLLDWRHSLDKKVALELYEREQLDYARQALDRLRPDLFLDIGAHAALYSVVLKTRLPALEVHAFEPDRTNLNQLYANLFVNRLRQGVQVHEHGLSDRAGTVTFDDSEETSSRGTRRISSSGHGRIEVKRLDDVLADAGRLAMLKIDVEGHECPVLQGARLFLGQNRCFLQVESAPEGFPALRSIMEEMGYRHIRTLGQDHYFTNIADYRD